MTLNEIQNIIADELETFRNEYHRRLREGVALVGEVGDYVAALPGKQLRPSLVLLAAKACGHCCKQHANMAAAVEMLHNASLLHDDVVDDSDERRGRDSVRHHWSNQIAVLCGDYYLSQVMHILNDARDFDASDIVNQMVTDMSEGELIQLKVGAHSHPDEKTYLDIIGRKTASLMAACCELGGHDFECKNNMFQQTMRDFGYHYGMAFQIRDDMHDLEDSNDIGFPQGMNPQQLVVEHMALARKALTPLPESIYKEALMAIVEI